jgi:hypothetical protein
LPKKRRLRRVAISTEDADEPADDLQDGGEDDDEDDVEEDASTAVPPRSTEGSRASSEAPPAPAAKKRRRKAVPTSSASSGDEDGATGAPTKKKARPRAVPRATSPADGFDPPPAGTPPLAPATHMAPVTVSSGDDEPPVMFQLLPPSWLQEILDPLEKHDDPRFKNLGRALDAFELAHEYDKGSSRGISTLGRPGRISEWFRAGRGHRSTQLPRLDAEVFGSEVQDWLVAIRPAWLQDIPTVLTGDEDWGLIGQHGQNGISLVARSIVWWFQAEPEDERLDSVVADLTWVLQGASAAVTTRVASSQQEQESEAEDEEDTAATPGPSQKQKRPNATRKSPQKRRR